MDDTTLESTLRDGRARALLAASEGLDSKERVALLKRAIRAIAFGTWPADCLDEMTTLGDEAIRVALESGDDAEANVLSFNLAANLCDCWGDAYTRETRHFEKGLAYAERALELRARLGSPPDKVAMAHWARGKHLLSLGRPSEATDALTAYRACLTKAADPDPTAALAADAYLAIARESAGEAAAAADYARAMEALGALERSEPARADDVKVYVDQLRATRVALGLRA
ncbi:MAG: hypothetical protein IT379_31165 [Deltaproteobacteria bacterium]|nr:hypothetical protein [Deltaproteobacteria bacterium]